MSFPHAPVLSVENLSLDFVSDSGTIHALDGISFNLAKGEILSLVGESGCGKSVTAMAIMGLLPRANARVTSGSVRLSGKDRAPQELLGLSERALKEIRGNRIGMVFQDPMTSLNPVHTIGMQITEVVRRHRPVSREAARARALQMLDLVRIPDAKRRIHSYPYELSGGQRQRVMIAMALACDPEVLIADEPTTALDVTVQAQILELIGDLKTDLGMSVILITHDLGVVAGTADRMMVMYLGRIVELGDNEAIFSSPSHPYTRSLLAAVPKPTPEGRGRKLALSGELPSPINSPSGCHFRTRCTQASDRCASEVPVLRPLATGQQVACHHAGATPLSSSNHEVVDA